MSLLKSGTSPQPAGDPRRDYLALLEESTFDGRTRVRALAAGRHIIAGTSEFGRA